MAALAGKIVVDCMNPLGRTAGGLGLVLQHQEREGHRDQGESAPIAPWDRP